MLLFSNIQAQRQKELAKFIVLEANSNGIDYTDWALEKDNYLIFFLNEHGELCFSNVTNGGQSYGSVSNMKHQGIKESYNSYGADFYTFRWRYINDYDDKKGSAIVELTKIYKQQAVAFEIKMIIENMDILIYKGYMEGSLNLDKYLY